MGSSASASEARPAALHEVQVVRGVQTLQTTRAQANAWGPLLTSSGFKRFVSRQHQHRGLEVFPDIVSDDPTTLRFLREVSGALNDALPIDVGEDGIAGPAAVGGDFNALRNVAGYGMDPLSVPAQSNRDVRASLKLADGFVSDRDKRIAENVFALMYGDPRPAPLRVPKRSSVTSPVYIASMVWKMDRLRHALANLERFLELIDRGDLRQLFVEFEAPIVYSIGERGQPDAVTMVDGVYTVKPREVNGERYARGLDRGDRFDADRSVFRDNRQLEGHFAYRRRTVYAMAFVANYIRSAFETPFREGYFANFGYTWKHRSAEHMKAKVGSYAYMFGFDVKQFDQTVGRFLVDFYHDQLERVVDHRVAKLSRLMFAAPFICPDPRVAGRSSSPFNPLFGADPFAESTFTNEMGLPSGIACNPDFAKFAMMFQYLCLLDAHTGDVVGREAEILRGEDSDYAFLNAGDDCVLATNDAGFVKQLRAGVKTAYFRVEVESPISFLGNVPYRPKKGELAFAPDVVSFLRNWWVPEKGIDNRWRREFWAIGDIERRKHYATAPAYHDLFRIYTEAFTDNFGYGPTTPAATHYDRQRAFAGMSHVDYEVLNRPETLLYKYDESQVSPNILSTVQAFIPADELWAAVAPFLKGV